MQRVIPDDHTSETRTISSLESLIESDSHVIVAAHAAATNSIYLLVKSATGWVLKELSYLHSKDPLIFNHHLHGILSEILADPLLVVFMFSSPAEFGQWVADINTTKAKPSVAQDQPTEP